MTVARTRFLRRAGHSENPERRPRRSPPPGTSSVAIASPPTESHSVLTSGKRLARRTGLAAAPFPAARRAPPAALASGQGLPPAGVQGGKPAPARQEAFGRAVLGDAAALDHQHPVGDRDRGQPVGDDEGGAPG